MNSLLHWILVLDCLLLSISTADSGDPLPDSAQKNLGLPGAPPGFHQAFDPHTGRFFLVVDVSAEKTAADRDKKIEMTDAEKDRKIEKTDAAKDQKIDKRDSDIDQKNDDVQSDQSRAGFGKLPAVPPGFRQAFDPRTGRFFLVVDPTAEKEAEKDHRNDRTMAELSLVTPASVAVLDQLPKGFRQVYDPQAGRFVLVIDATADTEKDKKNDGSLIPHEVTALLSGGGLVTLFKCLQVVCERMGWFKKKDKTDAPPNTSVLAELANVVSSSSTNPSTVSSSAMNTSTK